MAELPKTSLPQPNLGGPELGDNIAEIVEDISGLNFSSLFEKFKGTFLGGSNSASVVFFTLSVILIIWTIWFLFRIYQFRQQLFNKYKDIGKGSGGIALRGKMAEYWLEVLRHRDGASPSDWKLAVLEADSILDRLLTDLGYEGENLGERLKNVKLSEMATLNDAWDAHKMRNRIAHEGVEFQLTQIESKKTVSQFERVFREFDYI